MKVLFSDSFAKSLQKHASLRKAVQKKVDIILEHPLVMGEPLKGNFRGYYSCPVKKTFLIIYLYCKACRKKGDDNAVLCGDCRLCADDTIKFVDMGPHDRAYKM